MLTTGFRFIEQYKTLAKDLEQEASDTTSSYDQEVPQCRFEFEDCEMKYQIKLEEPDLFTMMESIINNDLSNTTDATPTKSCNYFNSISIKDEQLQSTVACAMSSSPSLLFTASSSPSTIPPSSSCSLVATNVRSSPTRNNHFLEDIPGAGYNVVPNIDFFTDNDSIIPDHGKPENSPEYIDMDRHQLSFYDDLQANQDFTKPGIMLDESKKLEEAAIVMRDTIYNDCDDLNVSYDPTIWTPEEVRKWVSWVCHRNNVPDVTSALYHFDGPTLCSMNQDTFLIICGDSGIKLSNELELWKAANSCFPNQMYNSNVTSFPSQQFNSQFLKNPHTFNTMTPCSSPALSSCSSSNHDSNTSSNSTHSYHSDDDSIYGSEISTSSASTRFDDTTGAHNKVLTKLPTGRGHKQTIHLWQFLQELLLSKDNKYSDCIRWLDRRTGVFKIEDSKRVATLWGARKNRPAMNYDKLSRSIRQYYRKGIIKKTQYSKRLVYQFCPGYL